jgi:LysR substrate binding domain
MKLVERILLAVASGAGMGLLPESVAERHAAPGLRFVRLDGDAPSFATAAVTRRDAGHLPTVAFLHAISQARNAHTVPASYHPSPPQPERLPGQVSTSIRRRHGCAN